MSDLIQLLVWGHVCMMDSCYRTHQPLASISSNKCVCSISSPIVDMQIHPLMFVREKAVMTILTSICLCTLTLTTCIYDAYMILRGACDYRDSTLTKNHLTTLLAHLLYLSSQAHPYLSNLSMIPGSIVILSGHPYIHSCMDTLRYHSIKPRDKA